MKIKLEISTDTLGYCNTDEDNLRYAAAVRNEIQSEYPDADVSVDIVKNVSASQLYVTDDPTGEVEENINLISNQVWDSRRLALITYGVNRMIEKLITGNTYTDGFFCKPANVLRYVGRRGNVERFTRVHEHPAVNGGVVDYKIEDIPFLKEIE